MKRCAHSALLGLVATGLAIHVFFVLSFKARADRSAGVCLAAEIAIRTGTMSATQLDFTPIGYAAWHLFPYYVTHAGKESAAIGNFGVYFRRDTIQLASHYSRSLRRIPAFNCIAPSDKRNVIATRRVRILWLYEAQYYVIRFRDPGTCRPEIDVGANFVDALFPMNDREWNRLIERGTL